MSPPLPTDQTRQLILVLSLVLSVGAHLLFFMGASERALLPDSTSPDQFTPLRFQGRLFDIEVASPDTKTAAASPPGDQAAASPPQLQKKPNPVSPPAREKESAPTPENSKPKPKPKPSPASPATEALPLRPAISKVDKPKPSSSPTTSTKNAPATPAKTTSPSGDSGVKAGGAYGQEDLPAGTVDLYRAFLKTLPLAAKSDPTWTKLVAGAAGTIEFSLKLDGDSRLLPIRIIENSLGATPSYLKKMVLLNRQFLLRGRFAIQSSAAGAKTAIKTKPVAGQRLRLSAIVSDKAPDSTTPHASGVRAFGIRGGMTPTGAYFTYFSGRHVELILLRR